MDGWERRRPSPLVCFDPTPCIKCHSPQNVTQTHPHSSASPPIHHQLFPSNLKILMHIILYVSPSIPLDPFWRSSTFTFFFFLSRFFFLSFFSSSFPHAWIKPLETQEEEAAKEEEEEAEGGRETTANEWLREWASHVSLYRREAGMGEKPSRGRVSAQICSINVFMCLYVCRDAGASGHQIRFLK